MVKLTDTINSRTWLDSYENIKISAYIENLMPALNISEKPLEQEDFSERLKQISLKVYINDFHVESELDTEFRSWESISDEALLDFEQNII